MTISPSRKIIYGRITEKDESVDIEDPENSTDEENTFSNQKCYTKTCVNNTSFQNDNSGVQQKFRWTKQHGNLLCCTPQGYTSSLKGFLRKVYKKQMDIDFALTQFLYLIIDVKQIYKLASYHKKTKSYLHRDDPAFLIILLFFHSVVGLSYGLALHGISKGKLLIFSTLNPVLLFFILGFFISTAGYLLGSTYFHKTSSINKILKKRELLHGNEGLDKRHLRLENSSEYDHMKFSSFQNPNQNNDKKPGSVENVTYYDKISGRLKSVIPVDIKKISRALGLTDMNNGPLLDQHRNKSYTKNGTNKNRLEWFYCFDIHCNASFPYLMLAYVIPFYILPILLQKRFYAVLLSNIFHLFGALYYWYVTLLGYSSQPYMRNTEHIVIPAVLFSILVMVATIASCNILHLCVFVLIQV